MPLFISIAIAFFSHELMINYMGIADGVALAAAWVIFFVSLWISDNFKPIKLLNASQKLLTQVRKENSEKIMQLEEKVSNLENDVKILKNQLNTIQGQPKKELEMEAELNFFKKTNK